MNLTDSKTPKEWWETYRNHVYDGELPADQDCDESLLFYAGMAAAVAQARLNPKQTSLELATEIEKQAILTNANRL